MKVIITKNYEELSRKTADIVVDLVKQKPNMVFCLPAGGSPIGMYECLVKDYREGKVSFRDMITYDMDEYVGIGPDNENSYAYFMQKHFLKYVDVQPENVHYPDGLAEDIDRMCEQYSREMFEAGGLDLAITGIGDDGHVAFNEPGPFLKPRTHSVQLHEETVKANARFFHDIREVPRFACSIGMEDIMRTRTFLVVASGLKKADIIARTFANDHIDPMWPVSFCRMHPNCIFLLDEDAVSKTNPDQLKEYQ